MLPISPPDEPPPPRKLIHDENSNDRLDTFVGIPREGIGFSMNPGFTFGPPRFAAARFQVRGGRESRSVRMRYFL